MNGQPRSILSENGEWILNVIKRNPEGLLLLAAGAALLLRTGSRPSGTARSMAARRAMPATPSVSASANESKKPSVGSRWSPD